MNVVILLGVAITLLIINLVVILRISGFLVDMATKISEIQYQLFVLTERTRTGRQKQSEDPQGAGLVDLDENKATYDPKYQRPKS